MCDWFQCHFPCWLSSGTLTAGELCQRQGGVNLNHLEQECKWLSLILIFPCLSLTNPFCLYSTLTLCHFAKPQQQHARFGCLLFLSDDVGWKSPVLTCRTCAPDSSKWRCVTLDIYKFIPYNNSLSKFIRFVVVVEKKKKSFLWPEETHFKTQATLKMTGRTLFDMVRNNWKNK